jgi:hypothetical protein
MRVSATAISWRVIAWFVIAITAFGVSAFAQIPPHGADSASDSDVSTAKDREKSIRVYMPDGQLKSHPIRAYVTKNISYDQKPQLHLLRNNAKTDIAIKATVIAVAPNQEWIELVNGQEIRQEGTLMLFDINSMNFGCKSMTRVTPVVSWNDGKQVAIGDREVNVGNIIIAIIWTIIVVGLLLLVLIRLSGNKPLLFLSGTDGHLSLAKTQVACWTIAVGTVILSYGLIRLEIPNIPQSLLALMGASLVTGGVASFQDDKNAEKKTKTIPVVSPRLRDLVCILHSTDRHMSLAKAQMLFWTVLLLLLFVTKSLLDGAIWEVPWELVALMGFSQAGYLAPKLAL